MGVKNRFILGINLTGNTVLTNIAGLCLLSMVMTINDMLFASATPIIAADGYNTMAQKSDGTFKAKFSLSLKTKNILKNLDKPIVITTLFKPDEFFYKPIMDVLKEYTYNSDKIKLENNVDPLKNRTKVEDLAKRLKIDALELNTVVFECGKYSKHVPQSEVIEKQYPFEFKAEKVFTEAIISITQEKQIAIYFITGHGERNLEDYDSGGISGISNALKRDNYRVAQLDILYAEKIPDDCDILVIAGPKKAYTVEEINKIRNYLDTMGNLLLMLEPAPSPNVPTGFKTLLAEYGIVVRDDVVVYNKVNMPLFGMQAIAELYISKGEYAKDHVITNDLTTININTILLGACSVSAAAPNDQQTYQAATLMNAPEGSWGETDVTNLRQKKPEYSVDTDLQGPVSLAVAAQVKELPKSVTQAHPTIATDPSAKPQGARLVVFGDVDFATNEYIDTPGNIYLFRNSVNWQIGTFTKAERERQKSEARKAKEEAKKTAVRKRYNEFVEKYNVKEWPSIDELYANPFVYQGNTIAINASFETMETAIQGILSSKGKFFVVSNIPNGLFKTGGQSVVIAGKVLGKTETKLPLVGTIQVPHLKFVGVHFCEEYDCNDIIQ